MKEYVGFHPLHMLGAHFYRVSFKTLSAEPANPTSSVSHATQHLRWHALLRSTMGLSLSSRLLPLYTFCSATPSTTKGILWLMLSPKWIANWYQSPLGFVHLASQSTHLGDSISSVTCRGVLKSVTAVSYAPPKTPASFGLFPES